ncbi:AraC family transcriptional regulator [Paenibacillus endoradicis]|uniref:AraC family transcriptional regulator n=1 Tax=Paenibacillus endoradicis TaxID=2972487 RepID=UPI0021590B3D|nr:AraC family transcriptional regulator [Paenibacillus endoradicis]MCR8660588.1 AraC family transcriptional regulator [Paenibacillus endoradicis]
MNTYRKTFKFDAEFPFEYKYRDATSAQFELPNHVHDWYEFVYIYSGRGTFFIDHSFYDAEAGDIYLIPGNTIHHSYPVEDDPKRATAFYFSAAFVHDTSSVGEPFHYLQPFETAQSKQSFRFTVPEAYRNQIVDLIEQIHHEYSEEKVGYRQVIRMHIQHILLLLNRHAEETWGESLLRHQAAALPQWIEQTLSYIDSHLEEELGLAIFARNSAVTPAHFSRVFKRLTGMNVTEYVTAKRVMRAKEMLRLNDRNIAQIAEACGFGSIPHFHRKFKALTGMTPAQYKHSL